MGQAAEIEPSQFERGFKTWAENASLAVRRNIGLSQFEALPCALLAQHLDVTFWSLDEVTKLPEASRKYLSSRAGDDWSAVTIVAQRTVIIVNPSHSPARRNSSGMHELSHILRGHQPAQIIVSPSGISLRSFNKLQEAEADWLAGCLLLPRTALQFIVRKRISNSDACETYGVSNDLLTYRLNISGVRKQYSRAKKG